MNAVCYKDIKEFIQVKGACCIVEVIGNCVMNAAQDLRNVGSFTAYECRCRQLSPIKLSLYPKQGWRENHITHVYHKTLPTTWKHSSWSALPKHTGMSCTEKTYKVWIPLTKVNFEMYFLEVAIG